MTSDGIVEPLDVVEHICSGLVPGAIGFSLGAFGFQRREEALHRRVVPDVAGSAHAANDAAVGHQALELVAGVLGGFKRSSQRSEIGGCDEHSRAAISTIGTSALTIAGPAAGGGA